MNKARIIMITTVFMAAFIAVCYAGTPVLGPAAFPLETNSLSAKIQEEAKSVADVADAEKKNIVVDSSSAGSEGTIKVVDDKGIFQKLQEAASSDNFAQNSPRLNAFLLSYSMIIVSELGDKTFFIAAILSMKHSATVVFLGAIAALAVMTVLASGLGVLLPSMISQTVTHWICVVLFFVFGVKLIYDGYSSDGSGAQDEMQEVIEEIGMSERRMEMTQITSHAPDAEVFGGVMDKDELPDLEEAARAKQRYHQSWYSVLVQAFTMTFLAEWGDRSQIASVALASTNDYIGVTVGGIVGHACCTGLAVIGGKMLASSISERTVSVIGGVLFLFFGMQLMWAGVSDPHVAKAVNLAAESASQGAANFYQRLI